ncbi:MAG: hypothetical protein WB424_04470 [Terracidiphilus sp.]|jgi:hypothetical protein
MLKSGETFLLPQRSYETEHLYFVLSDAVPPDNKALCVNITEYKSFHDKTVILKALDHPHPFVTKDSSVLYDRIKELDMERIDQLIALNTNQFVCKQHKPCSNSLLERLRLGVIQSPEVKPYIKAKYAQKWGMALTKVRSAL